MAYICRHGHTPQISRYLAKICKGNKRKEILNWYTYNTDILFDADALLICSWLAVHNPLCLMSGPGPDRACSVMTNLKWQRMWRRNGWRRKICLRNSLRILTHSSSALLQRTRSWKVTLGSLPVAVCEHHPGYHVFIQPCWKSRRRAVRVSPYAGR